MPVHAAKKRSAREISLEATTGSQDGFKNGIDVSKNAQANPTKSIHRNYQV